MLLFLFPNNKAAKKEEHAHLRQLYQTAKEKSAEFSLLVGREADDKKWNEQFVGFNRKSFFHVDAAKSRASMPHFGMQTLLSSVRNILQTGSTSAKLAAGERKASSGRHKVLSPGQHPSHGSDFHLNASDLTLSKRPFFGAHQVHPDPIWNDLERGVVNVEDSYDDSADANDNDYGISEGDEDADVESGKYGTVRSFKKEDYGSPSAKVRFKEGIVEESSEGDAFGDRESGNFGSVQSFMMEDHSHATATADINQNAIDDSSANGGRIGDPNAQGERGRGCDLSAHSSTNRVDKLYEPLFQPNSSTDDSKAGAPEL